jgi:hypothetical protein
VGNVRLIAGADLALSSVAPQQFLAFVSGKLSQLFIRDLSRACGLALDNRRDADGRFRINDLFCHANTWQTILSKLIRDTDVVLMDLRNFTRKNAGCIFELKELINSMQFHRLVFVIDDTTDRNFLERKLTEFWRDLRSDSPNAGLPAFVLRPFELRALTHRSTLNLLRRLCAAAG